MRYSTISNSLLPPFCYCVPLERAIHLHGIVPGYIVQSIAPLLAPSDALVCVEVEDSLRSQLDIECKCARFSSIMYSLLVRCCGYVICLHSDHGFFVEDCVFRGSSDIGIKFF